MQLVRGEIVFLCKTGDLPHLIQLPPQACSLNMRLHTFLYFGELVYIYCLIRNGVYAFLLHSPARICPEAVSFFVFHFISSEPHCSSVEVFVQFFLLFFHHIYYRVFCFGFTSVVCASFLFALFLMYSTTISCIP